MDSSVKAVSYMRGKLKLFKTRQAIFIYVLMFYLMFMLLQRPKFVPGAEFSSNKESASAKTDIRYQQMEFKFCWGYNMTAQRKLSW